MSECVDITLVDLPGISRISRQDSGGTQDIEAMTIGTTARYCQDDHRSLMVCVIPANVDLSTSQMLQLAREWDPKGQRTIGLITKVDLMDQGTDACEVLENRLIPLKLGYVGVKNRSKEDLVNGQNLAQCLKEEDNYFRHHPAYIDIKKRLIGLSSLTVLLAECMHRSSRQSLPLILRGINAGISAQEAVLNDLGTPLPQDIESRIAMMYKLVNELSDRFRQHMKGSLQSGQTTAQTNYSGGNILKVLFRELYDEEVRSREPVLSHITDQTIDRVIKMHQGDSIPGFPSIYAFMYLVSPLIESLVEPAKNCFSQIYTYIKVMVTELIQRVFQRFPALIDPVSEIVEALLEQRRTFTLRIIESNLQCELNYFHTNDPIYEKERTKLIPTPQRDAVIPQDEKKKPPEQREKLRKQRLFVTEIRLRVQAYYKVVLKHLREIIPKNIGHLFNQYLQDNLSLHLYQAILAKPELFDCLGEPAKICQQRRAASHELDTLKRALYSLKQWAKEQ